MTIILKPLPGTAFLRRKAKDKNEKNMSVLEGHFPNWHLVVHCQQLKHKNNI